MSQNQNKLSDQKMLDDGDQLAQKALGVSTTPQLPAVDEVAESDQLAETLSSLQSVIEKNAQQLQKIHQDLKIKRESLKDAYDNDTRLSEAKQQVDQYSTELKQRKVELSQDPTVISLQAQIGELNENKKDLEDTLSNYLVNYYQLTNSTSFDTSDGDQWEFTVKAKVKSKKTS